MVSQEVLPIANAQRSGPYPDDTPGSAGEHELQERYATRARAQAFYREQVLDRLNPEMQAFVAAQSFMFVATADARGECDCSFRSGLPGFVRVLDEHTLVYPEYRGNGVLASLGNISENGHVGLLFVDFFDSTVGLHVNGSAAIAETEEVLAGTGLPPEVAVDARASGGRRPERWVQVDVEEAYIHCAKHVPRLERRDKRIDWGTDDARRKGGDFFRARARRGGRG